MYITIKLYIYISNYREDTYYIYVHMLSVFMFARMQKGTLCEEAKFQQRPLSLWIRSGSNVTLRFVPVRLCRVERKGFNGSTWVRRISWSHFFFKCPLYSWHLLTQSTNCWSMKGTWYFQVGSTCPNSPRKITKSIGTLNVGFAHYITCSLYMIDVDIHYRYMMIHT